MRRRAALLLPTLMGLPAMAQTMPLKFYTAGPGSAFLPYGEGVAAYLSRQGITLDVRQSTGSLQNMTAAEDDIQALGTVFLGSAWDALEGTPAAGGRRHTRVRALFPMYETSFQVATLKRSGLTEFAQLAGKRVGVGPARGPAHTFFDAAAAAAGFQAQAVGGDPAALAEQLAKGEIDALWQGAIVPIPSLLAAARLAEVAVFGPGEATAAQVLQRLPYLSPTTVPRGTYPGQAAPIASFAAWNFVVCNAGLPDGVAHEVTRAVLGARDPAREIHPSAAATRATNAVNNRILPFHPGAARYYREQGVTLAAPA